MRSGAARWLLHRVRGRQDEETNRDAVARRRRQFGDVSEAAPTSPGDDGLLSDGRSSAARLSLPPAAVMTGEDDDGQRRWDDKGNEQRLREAPAFAAAPGEQNGSRLRAMSAASSDLRFWLGAA